MDERIKVVSLFSYLRFGGDESRVLCFARHVDHERFEHRVLVIAPPAAQGDDGTGPALEHYRKVGVAVDTVGVPLVDLRRKWSRRVGQTLTDAVLFLIILFKLVGYFRQHRTDLVDARMGNAMLVGLIAGKLAGVRAVVGTTYHTKVWKGWITWPLGQFTMSSLDALICDSQNNLDAIQAFLRFPNRRGIVIQNGVAVETATKTRFEMREEIGLPQDAIVIAQISRILPSKGHRELLQAAKIVVEHGFDKVVFLICGYAGGSSGNVCATSETAQPSQSADGKEDVREHFNYKAEMQALAMQLGISERVYWLHYPGDISDVWTAVDIHVHASLRESSPIAIHESMARGLPAVVTDAGGVRDELVVDGKTGVVVPLGDPVALGNGLCRVLEDGEFAATIAAAAQRRYEERHLPTIFTKAHEDLFTELVCSRGGPRRLPHQRGSP